MRVLALLLALWLALPAAAHPLSRDKYSLRTAVRLGGDQLEAVVVLEVPFQVVTAEIKDQLDAARLDPEGRRVAQQVIDAYAQARFAELAAGLSITIDGAPVKGSWKPKQSPYNGKGAVSEGFFVYIVELRPEGALPLDDDVTIVVRNTTLPDVPMAYSAWAFDGDGWRVASSSAAKVLPSGTYDPLDPAWWVEDVSLRTLTVRLVRAP